MACFTVIPDGYAANVQAFSRKTGRQRDDGHIAADGADIVRLVSAHSPEDSIRIHAPSDFANRQRAELELEHLATGPERVFAYVKRPEPGNPWVITLWTGHYLGLAWVGPRSRMGFGHNSYRRPVTTRILGTLYHGWYYESSGDYCRLKRAKNQHTRYAATKG